MGNQSRRATSLLIPASVLNNSFVCCLLSSRLPPHGPPSALSLFPFIPLTFRLIYFPIALILLFFSMFLPSHRPLSSISVLPRVSLPSFTPLPTSVHLLILFSFNLPFSFHSCIITIPTYSCLSSIISFGLFPLFLSLNLLFQLAISSFS